MDNNERKITELINSYGIKPPKGISPDFLVVLERNTTKHEKTIQNLVER